MQVSIHAPAWGATVCVPGVQLDFVVSIHAPAWGATVKMASEQNQNIVSIHAPAWGATVNLWSQVFHGLRSIIREPLRMSNNSSREPDYEKIKFL